MIFGGKGSLTDLLTESIKHEAVYRTAPATLGLLIIITYIIYIEERNIVYSFASPTGVSLKLVGEAKMEWLFILKCATAIISWFKIILDHCTTTSRRHMLF